VRFWLVTGALVVLAVVVLLGTPLTVQGGLSDEKWPFPRPIRAYGETVAVLETQGHARMMSLYIGLAAREIADGHLDTIYVPDPLNSLAERESDQFGTVTHSAFNPSFIQQASAGTLVAADYNTVLSADDVARLYEAGSVREYPREVFGVVGAEPESEAVLFTDEDGYAVYVVPRSLSPVEVRP
jgi:hypothetical protein